MVLRAFYILQVLVMAVACAIVPYILFRGSTTVLARGLSGKRACTTDDSASNTTRTNGKEEMPDEQTG